MSIRSTKSGLESRHTRHAMPCHANKIKHQVMLDKMLRGASNHVELALGGARSSTGHNKTANFTVKIRMTSTHRAAIIRVRRCTININKLEA